MFMPHGSSRRSRARALLFVFMARLARARVGVGVCMYVGGQGAGAQHAQRAARCGCHAAVPCGSEQPLFSALFAALLNSIYLHLFYCGQLARLIDFFMLPANPAASAPAHLVILHLDLDCFYAQVEQSRLGIPRDTPCAVQQW